MSTGDELLRAAAADLYGGDPDGFIERRADLAARARAAGQQAAAKQITSLRKPTRAAWIVNQLVRAEPQVPAQLTELGRELRLAQRSLEGATIRELSVRRRQLIDTLVRRAFAVAGQRTPPAALRGEVAATLNAALADPDAADEVADGALERAIRAEGFTAAGMPALTLVSSSSGTAAGSRAQRRGSAGLKAVRPEESVTARQSGQDRASRDRASQDRPGQGRASRDRSSQDRAERDQAERVRAERERAERERAERERAERAARRRAEAENAVAAADQAADEAARAQEEQEGAVSELEAELAEARQRLTDVRAQARRARAVQRQAHQSLDRLVSNEEVAGRAQAGQRARGRSR